MRKVGSRELKNRLGKYLARARKGQTIVVTDRGEPVAKLVPIDKPQNPEDALKTRLRELEAAGHIRLATGPFRDFKPVRSKGKLASRMIIEDRR
jgi:prevent-host-death family protein